MGKELLQEKFIHVHVNTDKHNQFMSIKQAKLTVSVQKHN